MNNTFHRLLSVLTLILTLNASRSYAYYETAESAEVIKRNTYRAGLMPQIRLSEGSGMNFTGYIDTGMTEATSLRLLLGGGETDMYTGGSFKWIPIPDYEKQPAIGGKLEVLYARKSSDSAVSLRIHPMISKKFDTEQGLFVPYAAIPFGTYTYQSTTETPVSFVAGTEFITPEVENMQFGVEMGLNANKSFSYISAFATLLLDENFHSKKGK